MSWIHVDDFNSITFQVGVTYWRKMNRCCWNPIRTSSMSWGSSWGTLGSWMKENFRLLGCPGWHGSCSALHHGCGSGLSKMRVDHALQLHVLLRLHVNQLLQLSNTFVLDTSLFCCLPFQLHDFMFLCR